MYSPTCLYQRSSRSAFETPYVIANIGTSFYYVYPVVALLIFFLDIFPDGYRDWLLQTKRVGLFHGILSDSYRVQVYRLYFCKNGPQPHRVCGS